MALEPQAAVEEAVLRAIRAIPGGLYTSKNSGRMYDGEPPPACGGVWVSVWSDLSRESRSDVMLDEFFNCSVTLTLRSSQVPWDVWIRLRDDMERRLNQIRAVVHRDCLYNAIQREASALMASDGEDQRVGFRERLKYEGIQGVQHVGPNWFKAEVDRATEADSGLACTVRFGGLRLTQALATME